MKNLKKCILGLMVAFVLTVAIAQPAYAAENIFQKISHSISSRFERAYLTYIPGDKAGDAVLKQAFESSQKIKSGDIKVGLNIDMLKDSQKAGNAVITVSGPFEASDVYDPASYKQDMNLSGEVTVQGTTLRGAADLKVAADTFYFRINELPAIPGMNFDAIKGKWLKTKNTSTKTPGQDSKFTAEDQEKMRQATTDLIKKSQLSKARRDKKDSHNVYIVDVTVPKAALVDYFKQIEAIQAAKLGAPDDKMLNPNASFEKMLDNVTEVKATFWVDQSSFFIRHFEIPLSYTVPPSSSTSSLTNQSTNPMAALSDIDEVKIMITGDLDNFNKKITFEEPRDAQDAAEAFGEMIGAGMGGTGVMEQDEIDTMMKANDSTSLDATIPEMKGLTPAQKLQLQKYQQMQKNSEFMVPTSSDENAGY